MKLCECGCGKSTRLAPYSDKNRGWKRGESVRFIHGHHNKLQPTGKNAHRWNGGRSKMQDGRVLLHIKNHHRSNNGYVLRSVVMAEKAIGKPLPPQAEVHHFDEDTGNDQCNLIICENRSYHRLLHKRKKAHCACGHADWLKCKHCKQYDDPKNLSIVCDGKKVYHRVCERDHTRERRKNKK